MSKNNSGNCGDWKAWHDRMPGKKATLHVVGKCTFGTPGYTVRLQPQVPQGTNPAIYLLQKIVTPPTGLQPQVVTTVPVSYQEQTNAVYTDVQILPDETTVPVEEVQ